MRRIDLNVNGERRRQWNVRLAKCLSLVLIFCAIAGLSGCDGRESARKEIEKRAGGYSTESFFSTLGTGTVQGVDLFLKAGMDVNLRLKKGYTPLMVALRKGRKNIAQFLISRGADINVQGEDGFTA